MSSLNLYYLIDDMKQENIYLFSNNMNFISDIFNLREQFSNSITTNVAKYILENLSSHYLRINSYPISSIK